MPTVLKFLGYRAVIYPNDHQPCHVHVLGSGHEAVFWLVCPEGPPALRVNHGFRKRALTVIHRHLGDHLGVLCKKWSEIHGHH